MAACMGPLSRTRSFLRTPRVSSSCRGYDRTPAMDRVRLGTFPEVYQQHAVKDFPFYANHAHNDWAEFAADGGLPFLLLVLVPFAMVIPTAVRHPWGIGLLAVMLHACVDYPFPRPGVSGWIFALAGILYMTRESDMHLHRAWREPRDAGSSLQSSSPDRESRPCCQVRQLSLTEAEQETGSHRNFPEGGRSVVMYRR